MCKFDPTPYTIMHTHMHNMCANHVGNNIGFIVMKHAQRQMNEHHAGNTTSSRATHVILENSYIQNKESIDNRENIIHIKYIWTLIKHEASIHKNMHANTSGHHTQPQPKPFTSMLIGSSPRLQVYSILTICECCERQTRSSGSIVSWMRTIGPNNHIQSHYWAMRLLFGRCKLSRIAQFSNRSCFQQISSTWSMISCGYANVLPYVSQIFQMCRCFDLCLSRIWVWIHAHSSSECCCKLQRLHDGYSPTWQLPMPFSIEQTWFQCNLLCAIVVVYPFDVVNSWQHPRHYQSSLCKECPD